MVMETPSTLAEHIHQARLAQHDSTRLVVAIVGAPGSGKSTLAADLGTRLQSLLAAQNEAAIVVPMDGFHLDNDVLDQHGTRAVKGSPPTFDVAGLISLVRRLSSLADGGNSTDAQDTVYAPLFDREADLARNAALAVQNQHSIVLVEGNYLLLERPGWRDLRAFFDMSIMLDVPEQVLEERLIQRWLDHGHTQEQARARALSNDIPNARVVLAESASAHLNYKSVRQ